MDLATANRLQQLRKMNGYSQDVLAEKLGISRQAISKWERAESSPDTDNLIALANLYGMTLDELLNSNSDKVVVNTNKKVKRDFKGKFKSLVSKANDFGIYPQTALNLIRFPYALIIVFVYIAVSAVFKIWHPFWLIFLTIPIYYRYALACKANNKKVFNLLLPIPEIIVTVYLSLCFATSAWGELAFIFVAIPVYYWIVLFFSKA